MRGGCRLSPSCPWSHQMKRLLFWVEKRAFGKGVGILLPGLSSAVAGERVPAGPVAAMAWGLLLLTGGGRGALMENGV